MYFKLSKHGINEQFKTAGNYSPRATCIVVSLVDRKLFFFAHDLPKQMHFLAIKVVFSCLGHNGKFVSSSNAREILCLVSKIPCVARYKGPWGKVRVVAKASYSDLLRA